MIANIVTNRLKRVSYDEQGYYTVGFERRGDIRDEDWVDLNPLLLEKSINKVGKKLQKKRFDKVKLFSYHAGIEEILTIPLSMA